MGLRQGGGGLAVITGASLGLCFLSESVMSGSFYYRVARSPLSKKHSSYLLRDRNTSGETVCMHSMYLI